MKLNHADIVLDWEGNALKELVAGDQTRDMTFRSLVFSALNSIEKDEHVGAEEKARCANVAGKFFTGKFVRLTVDEAALIKKRGGAVLTPLAYGRLAEWIEGNPQLTTSDDAGDDLDDDEPA